ncbi:MAG TPA: hypothetical protein VLD37_01305 [Candidatus Bilamarchaeum sp.]|nr:hypothetical protein [Candidatus Bilamarchaeum sp.]
MGLLDFEAAGPQLKRIKMSELDPELLDKVLELAWEHGEISITSSTDLEFVYRIYKAEKAKDEKGRELLKKAEGLIVMLGALHHDREMQERREQRTRDEKSKMPHRALMEDEINVGAKTRALFGSIGIEDEREMQLAIGLLGERKIEQRIALAKKSALGDKLLRSLFSENPELIRIARDDDFIQELSAIENKRDMIDRWKETNKLPLPVWADYNQSPSVLLVEYTNMYRALVIGMDEGRLDAGPRSAEQVVKMLREIGFTMQEKDGALIIKGPDGKAITIPEGPSEMPHAMDERKAWNWLVGGEEVSPGEQVSTGKILRTVESIIRSKAMAGDEVDVIVVTGDKRKLSQINQLFGRNYGDHALDAYRKIFDMAVTEAAGRGTPHLIRPSMSGDETIGIIVVQRGEGGEVREKLRRCLEEATSSVFRKISQPGTVLGGAMKLLRNPRDSVEALIDISEPVFVRNIEGSVVATRPDGSDAMITRPDGMREFLAAQVRTTDEQGSARHAPALRKALNTPTSPQIESRTALMDADEKASGVAFELKMAVSDQAILNEMQALLPFTGKGLYEVARNSFGIRGLNTFLGHYGANGLIQEVENAVGAFGESEGLDIRRTGTLKYVIESGTAEQAAALKSFVDRRLDESGIGLRTIVNPKAVRDATPAEIEGQIANGHLGLEWASNDYANANAAISAMAIGSDLALAQILGPGSGLDGVTGFIRGHPEVRNYLDFFTAVRSEGISGSDGQELERQFSAFIRTRGNEFASRLESVRAQPA